MEKMDLCRRRYAIAVHVETVEKLDAAPGTEVVCCWKWNDDEKDRMVCSHSTEVWDNGDMSVAQFDAALKEEFVLTTCQNNGLIWQPKYCTVEIQAISIASSSEECSSEEFQLKEGVVLASQKINLSDYCKTDSVSDQDDSVERLQFYMKPQGTMLASISTQALEILESAQCVDKIHNARISGNSGSCVDHGHVPSLMPETGTDNQEDACGHESQHVKAWDLGANKYDNVNLSDVGNYSDCKCGTDLKNASSSSSGHKEDSESFDRKCNETPTTYYVSETSSCSQALSFNTKTSPEVFSKKESSERLSRKCRRLMKQRDEARAEAFTQASLAVQRGIEVENLKRAKEMLLKRLETTELQLMGINKSENEEISDQTSSIDTSDDGSSADKNANTRLRISDPICQDESESMLAALVEAKLMLAEREFEVMELQGQVRARESHIEMLTEHLAAIREAAEEEHRHSSPVKPGLSTRLDEANAATTSAKEVNSPRKDSESDLEPSYISSGNSKISQKNASTINLSVHAGFLAPI